ncbi:MAG: ferritin-like domain-containing protein [Chitinophagaceae bacterium]
MKEALAPSITTLHDLLDYDVARFVNAEILLKNNIPSWTNRATSIKLKEVLLKYTDQIVQHLTVLDKFIEAEEINSLVTRDRVMYAFIEELHEKLARCTDNEVKDACLLAGIQRVNHYKISLYGTAAAFAKTLGMDEFAKIFHDAEVNEKQIDDRLSQLAKYEVNLSARSPIVLEK